MRGKPKDMGKTKSLDDLLHEEKRSVRRGVIKRNPPKNNFFPFSPARPNSENPLGLELTSDDCKILKGVQKFGYRPLGEFCKLAKIKPAKLYNRLKNSRDLVEALRFLGYSPLLLSFPQNMETLSKNFGKSKPWADLWCEIAGLKKGDQTKITQVLNIEAKGNYLTEKDIQALLGE